MSNGYGIPLLFKSALNNLVISDSRNHFRDLDT